MTKTEGKGEVIDLKGLFALRVREAAMCVFRCPG